MIVLFAKQDRIPAINWRTRPSRRSLAAVRDRLGAKAASSLTHARVEWRTAAEVLKAAHRDPLPMTDPDIERHLVKVREGRQLHPVVVDGPVIVDGHHVLSVAYHRSQQEQVPVLDVAESESLMSKKSNKSLRKASDAVEALGDSLVTLRSEARRANLTPSQRQVLSKASQQAEDRYLRSVRPWSVESDIAKSDTDDLLEKADRIEKSDPTVSRYRALRKAAERAA